MSTTPFKQYVLSRLLYIRLVKSGIKMLGIIHVPISVCCRLFINIRRQDLLWQLNC